jgi:hypothetical protein
MMANVRTGKAQAKTADPTHVKGIKQGNSVGNYERQAGHLPDGRRTAESSTGVNAKARNPIDPRMPNLPPA